jgi:hypothetical protein
MAPLQIVAKLLQSPHITDGGLKSGKALRLRTAPRDSNTAWILTAYGFQSIIMREEDTGRLIIRRIGAGRKRE